VTIKTKLHVIEEVIYAAEKTVDPLVLKMMEAPKFYVDRDVVKLLQRSDAQSSIAAMIKAGVARLPYNPLLLEYETFGDSGGKLHCCVLLTEKAGGFHAEVMFLYDTSDGRTAIRSTVLNKEILVYLLYNEHDDSKPTIKVEGNGSGDKLDCEIVAYATMMALLMLNIRGIEKQHIETRALNKSREKKGKGAIPEHTIVHIGTVFDRNGRGQRFGGNTGRTMPVHLRRGHARHQACGEGMKDHRWVYIPPVLVNYKEDGDKPRTPEQLIRV
jgi:hypothetical protein